MRQKKTYLMLGVTEFGGFNTKGAQSHLMENSQLQFHTPAKLIPLRLYCSTYIDGFLTLFILL